jgi:nitric oxide reductase subunit C
MIKALHIYIVLILIFIGYTIIIYTQPTRITTPYQYNLKNAQEGRLVWQNYNCQSCHQLYSLGGYLGPDLTNEMAKNNGEIIIKNIVKSGTGAMPAFKLNETELNNLIEFLKMTNESGIADLRNFTPNINGTITTKVK